MEKERKQGEGTDDMELGQGPNYFTSRRKVPETSAPEAYLHGHLEAELKRGYSGA